MPVSAYSSSPTGNLFAGTDFTDSEKIAGLAGSQAGDLSKKGNTLFGKGSELFGEGGAALAPVLGQLLKILSGNSADLTQAIEPQVRGVVDQYDTARRAAAEFTPRGGGQASENARSRSEEAGKISEIRSNAITSATKDLQSLGAMLLSQGNAAMGEGLNAEASAMNTLMGLVRSAMEGEQQKRSNWLGIGKLLGSVLLAPFTGGTSLLANLIPTGGGKPSGSSSGQSASDWS